MLDLYAYQKQAVAQIAAKPEPTYLADEMGVGKSATAIAVAKQRGVKRLLIVCPSVAKLTWVKELKRWWPEMKVTVVDSPAKVATMNGEGAFIISYALLSMSKSGSFDYTAAVRNVRTYDMTVLDEAHALKNPKAIRTRAVLVTLKPVLGWCLPMSGTPMPNHAGELHAILYALFPDVIRKTDGKVMKQTDFEDAYCTVENRWFSKARPTRVITGSKNLDILKERLGPHIIRRKKRDVLKELPDMSFDTYPVPVSDQSLVWVEPDDWKELSDDEKLERLQRDEEHIMRKRHQLGVAKLQGSIEAIIDALEGSNRKVLVFAHHADVIDGLVRGLGDYNPVVIDGRTKTKDREDAVDLFLNNPTTRVFIGNILAAGTSITLIGPKNECSDVFFVEADWSPGNNVQAASRVHRIGQKDAVQVWFLTADGTLDDLIQDILARKARDFQLLFGA